MRKKKEEQPLQDAIEKFYVQANNVLDMLEKRISLFYKKLSRLRKVIEEAAKSGEKDILVEALRAQKSINAQLKQHLGWYRNIQQILSKIEMAQMTRISTTLLERGRDILERISEQLSPERVEEVMAGLEEAVAKIETSTKISAEPLSLEEPTDTELEEEADKLIAKFSLPSPEKEEKEKRRDELEKELRKILEMSESEE
ncbi:MAG: Snf7 family protein [Candidatus Njordarchaeales archaeon]